MSDWDDPRSPWYRFDWPREVEGAADELEERGPHEWCDDYLAEAVLVAGGEGASQWRVRRFINEVNEILEERRGYSQDDDEDEDEDEDNNAA